MSARKRRAGRVTPALDREVVAAAQELRGRPGVVGVFWGFGTTDGRRDTQHKRLCVHVRWKRAREDVPDDELILGDHRGIPTDVVEVGRPRAHALDFTDALTADNGLRRHGAITAIARDDANGALALMSGHVALPLDDGTIVHTYGGGGGVEVSVAENGGSRFVGDVERGELGGSIDFALARFGQATGPFVSEWHAAGGSTPFNARSTPLSYGDQLHHFSCVDGRNKTIFGTYDQQSASSADFTLPDRQEVAYDNLLVVRSTDTLKFSVLGDSGSLVVDDQFHVVGMILGAGSNGDLAYVLPVSALRDHLGDEDEKFFA